jgi:LmbE family N-acetylglucosaminyl deacetylase
VTHSVDLPTPARALAIGAHADDVEFGAGATLAKWAAAGCRLQHVVCTDGSKGSWDPDGEVLVLGWPDGELESGPRQRAQVASAIRRFKPDVVLGHDPWKRYRLHPDHRNAGLLAVEGVVAARDPHFFPELALPHHRPRALLLFEAEEPDHVEVVNGFAERKLSALLAHRSQLRSTMHIDDAGAQDQLTAFEHRVLATLSEHGTLVGVAHGEAFKAITDL